VEGFETYVLLAVNPGPDQIVWMVGCNGGHNSTCTPTIGRMGAAQLQGPQPRLVVNTTYRMEVAISTKAQSGYPNGYIGMRLFNMAGSILADLESATAPNADFTIGLLVGRSGLTCADNFLVETVTPFKSLFSDSFNRANGPAGSNYIYLPASLPVGRPAIVDNKLCADNHAIAYWKTSVKRSATYRISYLFSAATNQGYETYIMAGMNVTDASTFSSYLIGCDGGGSNGCNPHLKLLQLPNNTNLADGITPPLQPNRQYKFIATYKNGLATFRVYISNRLLTVVTGKVSFAGRYYLGVLVGRSGLSCIDDLSIQATD